MPSCYLNGEVLPLEEARIPVLDRGFIFGDGVYEVIPVFGGRLFRLEEHLKRLAASLKAVRIPRPLGDEEWTAVLMALVDRNGGGNQSVYLQVTRGVAPRDLVLAEPVSPTVFAMSNPLTPPREPEPVGAVTCDDIRWRYCHIKAIGLLPNVLLRLQAADAGAYEAILIRDGRVTEGAASNVFAVHAGVVTTPPKGPELLPGITRDLIVELLQAAHLPCHETLISAEALASADEILAHQLRTRALPGHDPGRSARGPRGSRTAMATCPGLVSGLQAAHLSGRGRGMRAGLRMLLLAT